MSKLSTRKYDALVVSCQGMGKWYTGWEGNAFTKQQESAYLKQWPNCDVDRSFNQPNSTYKRVEVVGHETRQLRLQFSTTRKGRSAAVAVFKDKEGYSYDVSFNSLELILCLLHQKRGELQQKYDISETRDRNGTWVEGTFIQVKRGQNYFIEPVMVE